MKAKRFLCLLIVATVITSLLSTITVFAEEVEYARVYINGIGYGNSIDISIDERESSFVGCVATYIAVSPDDEIFEGKLYTITIELETEEDYIFTDWLDVGIYCGSPVKNVWYNFISETMAIVSFDVDFTNEVVLEPIEPGVEINESNFPDEILREYVQSFDLRNDDVLTDSEIEAVTQFVVPSKNITDFTGIEYFTCIDHLNISGNPIEVLPDLLAFPNLTYLDYKKTGVSSWDLSEIASGLISLDCSENGITTLNMTGFSNLEYLYAQSNNLSEIDLTCAPNLTKLHLQNNNFTYIDITCTPNLTELFLQNNNLTYIDLSPAPKLTILHLENNKLKTLDISQNPELGSIYVTNNCLTSLDLEQHTKCGWAELNKQTATIDLYSDTFDLSVLGNPDKITVLSGGTVTGTLLTVTEESVVYEYASGHGTDKLVVTLTVNIADSPALTITVNSDSYGTVKTNISNPTPGEAVTLTTMPQSGYRFEGWVVKSGEPQFLTDNVLIMGNSECHIMAVFVPVSNPESMVLGIKVTDNTGLKGSGKQYEVEITLDFTSGVIINSIYDGNMLIDFTFTEISLRAIQDGYILVPEAEGDGNNEKLMFWKSMESMKELCIPISI